MERRKFIKKTSVATIGATIVPLTLANDIYMSDVEVCTNIKPGIELYEKCWSPELIGERYVQAVTFLTKAIKESKGNYEKFYQITQNQNDTKTNSFY
jgi:hypothetical protein